MKNGSIFDMVADDMANYLRKVADDSLHNVNKICIVISLLKMEFIYCFSMIKRSVTAFILSSSTCSR